MIFHRARKYLSIIIGYIFPLTLLFLTTFCSEQKPSVEKVFINTIVFTVDDANPTAEAIAVNADTIFAVGSKTEIEALIGDITEVIDLQGNYVYPGFNDSHAHFLGVGESKMNLDLMDAKNWGGIIKIVADAADRSMPGEWIVGRGWHQDKWNMPPIDAVDGYPVNTILSQASPLNPVILSHASGHAIIANARAMDLAGITKDTEDPEGGRIVRDKDGNPTGVFEENAELLIQNMYKTYLAQKSSQQLEQEKIKAVKLAVDECLKYGITSLTDAGSSLADINFFKKMVDDGILKIRLNTMIEEKNSTLKKCLKDYKILGYGNNHLTVRSIKKYIDGALGSRGAWMLEPYDDMPDHSGLNVTPLDELRQTAKIAVGNGFQMCTHSIGDKANREILNIYENEFKKHPGKTNLRWRVEHAQHLSAQDIPRFGKLGVIAAMQGVHCTSDAVFVPDRIGDDRSKEGAYVWRKLMDSGAVISNGTDSPVERLDPFKCFYASVTRKLDNGKTFYEDQKMTRMEALKSYTINGAYASFEENIKGSIKKGKLADFVVIDKNLITCPEEEIKETKVIYTIIGGKILFENK